MCNSSMYVYCFKTMLPWLTRRSQKSKTLDKGKGVAKHTDGELPPELDFFKFTQGGPGKRKVECGADGRSPHKKAKVDEDDESDENSEEHEDEDEEQTASSSAPRQRVTAKGNNVPEHVKSFADLAKRYNLPSRLLSNIAQSGYKQPTGIQSHGVPILLEVRITSDL